MSNLTFQQPVIHTPSFKEFKISAPNLIGKLKGLGFGVPMGMLDAQYFFTDLEGWGKVLQDLVFKSNLYKTDKFDCENYALKAMNACAERYGLNTLCMVIGNTPQGRHGFNIFYYGGDGFMLWEPNEGYSFSGSAFEIGEYGYRPDTVLV